VQPPKFWAEILIPLSVQRQLTTTLRANGSSLAHATKIPPPIWLDHSTANSCLTTWFARQIALVCLKGQVAAIPIDGRPPYKGGFVSQDHLGLFDTPPSRRQLRFSYAIVGLLLAVFLVILPVRGVRVREIDSFIPMIDALLLLGELMTATLLYAQAVVFRSRALLALATGYLSTALLIIPHALTFPGAFAPSGLLGAKVSTAAWIADARWALFPCAILLYLKRRRDDLATRFGMNRAAARISAGVMAAVALTVAVATVATSQSDVLPPLFLNRSEVVYAHVLPANAILIVISVFAMVFLFRRRSSMLDMWLLVASSAWLIQLLLILTLPSRFTIGWYCQYALTLFSRLVVLFALIAESNRLYARLAISTLARNRERDARLMSMDAVAAAIAHEVKQPLGAIVTNASAGLRWLGRESPNIEMAMQSLQANVEQGHRASDLINSMRSVLARQSGEPTTFNLNELVGETASLLDRELVRGKISLRLALDETLPPIMADRVQMQQVLVNLFTNAIQALRATRGRARHIEIHSAPMDDHDVLLDVSDNGIGISAEKMEHIFDAFFTTKATGTGMGLSLCRTIVEKHGGRLWASQGEQNGAIFHLQLPRSSTAES
jgi:signal transduction histidine kinase